MKEKYFLTFGLIIVLVLSIFPSHQTNAMTLTVNTGSDEHDGSCSDGDCSLRDAIIIANTNPGPDTININIPPLTDPGCMGGICFIYPLSELPALTGGGTTINGYSQTGAARATTFTPATIKIEIDGRNLTTCENPLFCNGFLITSSDNLIEGLSMHHFAHNAVVIGSTGAPAANNVIKGNYLGVGSSGTTAAGNGLDGVFIGFNAENNTIGGNEPAHRNVISGNDYFGVEIWGTAAFNNQIVGNYIGVDHNGTVSLANEYDGIRIYGGAHNNTVGGNTNGERNIISGNHRSGVRLVGLGTNGNVVMGNYIGVDKTGLAAKGNISEGVYIGNQAQLNLIGGDTVDEGNLISGNLDLGVVLTDTNTMSNTVSGNKIGLNWNGSGVLGNSGSGVYLYNASHNLIGGDTQGERNYISGNYYGVALYGAEAHENVVSGNYIGTNVSGFDARPNIYSGVIITSDAHDNRIGGGAEGERNLISGNTAYGVILSGSSLVSGNVVSGNYIGTDTTGEAALGNGDTGVMILGASNNQIGGEALEEWNVISGNGGYGVSLGGGASENTIYGNIIGLISNLQDTLPNGSTGILLAGAHDNQIGGEATGDYASNYICGNNGDGVSLNGVTTFHNVVSGNDIGLESLGNNGAGISILNGANNNTIGGADGLGNVISNNGQYGIAISFEGSDSNVISYNLVTGNFLSGILVWQGEDNRIGPKNAILANGADGVLITGSTTIGNIVTENAIGLNADFGIHLASDANGGMLAPGILAQETTSVSGKACAGCIVELFASNDAQGEGWIFLNKTTAGVDGSFSLPLINPPFSHLTATATDAIKGTSQFSAEFLSTTHFVMLPLVKK